MFVDDNRCINDKGNISYQIIKLEEIIKLEIKLDNKKLDNQTIILRYYKMSKNFIYKMYFDNNPW